MAEFQDILRCFYSDNTPRVHNLQYCSCEIFMALTLTIYNDDLNSSRMDDRSFHEAFNFRLDSNSSFAVST